MISTLKIPDGTPYKSFTHSAKSGIGNTFIAIGKDTGYLFHEPYQNYVNYPCVTTKRKDFSADRKRHTFSRPYGKVTVAIMVAVLVLVGY